MTRREEIVRMITMLAENFGRTTSAATFMGYEIGLEGIELPAIRQAVALCLKRLKYMPSASEIREMAGELRASDRAEQAWIVFVNTVAGVGGYKTVCFDDPAINAAVRSLGGWIHVCELTGDEFNVHLRREFLKTYASLCSAGVGDEHSRPLIGIIDRENARNGFPPQKIVKVITGLPPAAPAPRLNAPKPPNIEGSK